MADALTDVQNSYQVVLPSAARTADATVDLTNYGAKGVVVVVDLTAFVTAASLTVTIQGYDSVSGKTWTILASAAIVAVSTVTLKVYPGLTAAANLTASDVLPLQWRVFADLGNANSHTFSIGASLIE